MKVKTQLLEGKTNQLHRLCNESLLTDNERTTKLSIIVERMG